MARQRDPGARDRILDAASRLFAEHGVHAVGLQRIIDECGCGKNLLYREFANKDDLVVAHLQRCRQEWQAIVDEAAREAESDPARQLVALVRAVVGQASQDGFRGCPLRNAYPEFPDRTHPVHQVIVTHHAERRDHLRGLARQAGARDPDALAARVDLVIDGINANGAVLGAAGSIRAAVALAEDVVNAQCGAAPNL
jgi:AcrR family transcriptional regulator